MAGTGNLLLKRGTLVPAEGTLLKGMPAVQLQGLSTPVNTNGTFGGDFAANNYENRLWIGIDSYGCSYVDPVSVSTGEFVNTPYLLQGAPLICSNLPKVQATRPIWMGAEIRAQKSVKTSTVFIKSILVTQGSDPLGGGNAYSKITIEHDTLASPIPNNTSFTITDTKISTEEIISTISSNSSGVFTVTHEPFDVPAAVNDFIHIRNSANPIFNGPWQVSSVLNNTFTVITGNSATYGNQNSTGGIVNKTYSMEYPSGSFNSISRWLENTALTSTTTTTYGDSGFTNYYLNLNAYAVVGRLKKDSNSVNYKIRNIVATSATQVDVTLGPSVSASFTSGETVTITGVTADGYNVTAENNLQFNRQYTVSSWTSGNKLLKLNSSQNLSFWTESTPKPYGIAGKLLVSSSQNTDAPIILKADWNNPSDYVLATQQAIAYAPNRLYAASDIADSQIALSDKKYVELKSPNALSGTGTLGKSVVLTVNPSGLSSVGQFLKITSVDTGVTPATATIGFVSAFTGDPESPANYALLNEEGAERGTQTFKSKIRIDEELIINGTELQSLNDGITYNPAVISSLAEDAYLFNENVLDLSIGGGASVISIGNPSSTNNCTVTIYDELVVTGNLQANSIDGGSF